MSISCGCMDMWLVFLTLILLTRFSQRGSLLSREGQWADHVLCGCSRLINISRRWGWARHLPGGWPDGGPRSTGGKWTQRRAVPAHVPIPDLTNMHNNIKCSLANHLPCRQSFVIFNASHHAHDTFLTEYLKAQSCPPHYLICSSMTFHK